MIKIGILNKGPKLHWGKNFGYWFFVKYFQNELKDSGFDIEFFDTNNKKFYSSDFIIIDSRLFSDSIENKIRKKINLNTKNQHLENLIKISKLNQNIIWLDNSDSAGTTSFEVLPYVKKYVKKQYYKDKNLYRKNFFRGRLYSDFYQKKYALEKNFKSETFLLPKEYENKLVLGWNIGVGNYFDVFNFNKINKFQCIINSLFRKNYKELFKYTLKYYNLATRKQKVFYKFNLRNNDKKKSIHFQRNRVNEILKDKFSLSTQRLNHRSYLEQLKNSQISVGAFGWGEICYREFEAIKMGAAIIFPNIDYLETWPNIYQDNFSYVSYELDFSNLIQKIDLVINNQNLRESLIENSQKIHKSVYSDVGLNYLINFFKKIIN